MKSQEYTKIVNAINAIQEMVNVNNKMIEDGVVSDYDRFIVTQNKHLKVAINVMAEKIGDSHTLSKVQNNLFRE